jgi:catechol 2,3-dioxygenase-like lactoylglutathione lyase family enzyme
VESAGKYLTDYGLVDNGSSRFEALNGTSVVVLDKNDPSLPPALTDTLLLRKTIYGVADQAALDAIKDELSKDRTVKVLDDGSIESHDDDGFCLGFEVTQRKPITEPGEKLNSPGEQPGRKPNQIGQIDNLDEYVPKPRSLSHIVYFSLDPKKAEEFYASRLGFVTTDEFIGVGPFMRPAGTNEHHTLFLLPSHGEPGLEHFTFHMAGPGDFLLAGRRFSELGYQTFWGPGRHFFGSNYFWYFKSPFNCHMEYDADMDLHDDDWVARKAPPGADRSQAYLFDSREIWMPGPDSGAHQNDK